MALQPDEYPPETSRKVTTATRSAFRETDDATAAFIGLSALTALLKEKPLMFDEASQRLRRHSARSRDHEDELIQLASSMRDVTRQWLLSDALRGLVLNPTISLEDAVMLVEQQRGSVADWISILVYEELQQLRGATPLSGECRFVVEGVSPLKSCQPSEP